MPFNMNFSRESLSGSDPAPSGWYQLQFKGFKQVASNNKDSINLNPQFEIINHPEHDGKKVWSTMNTKGTWVINDFVHATGNQMQAVNGDPDSLSIPGVFKDIDSFPDNPEKWEYLGPLTNSVFEAEVFISDWNGKKSSKVKQFKCAVPGCTERHSTNLEKS